MRRCPQKHPINLDIMPVVQISVHAFKTALEWTETAHALLLLKTKEGSEPKI